MKFKLIGKKFSKIIIAIGTLSILTACPAIREPSRTIELSNKEALKILEKLESNYLSSYNLLLGMTNIYNGENITYNFNDDNYSLVKSINKTNSTTYNYFLVDGDDLIVARVNEEKYIDEEGKHAVKEEKSYIIHPDITSQDWIQSKYLELKLQASLNTIGDIFDIFKDFLVQEKNVVRLEESLSNGEYEFAFGTLGDNLVISFYNIYSPKDPFTLYGSLDSNQLNIHFNPNKNRQTPNIELIHVTYTLSESLEEILI
jgi:hypothetical protein